MGECTTRCIAIRETELVASNYKAYSRDIKNGIGTCCASNRDPESKVQ